MFIQTIIRRIQSFVISANLAGLIYIPLTVGICIIILTVKIWPDVFDGIHIQLLLISLGFICIGLSGVPQIVRREGYDRVGHYMNGILSVVSGVLIIFVFFTIAMIPIFFLGLRIISFILLNR